MSSQSAKNINEQKLSVFFIIILETFKTIIQETQNFCVIQFENEYLFSFNKLTTKLFPKPVDDTFVVYFNYALTGLTFGCKRFKRKRSCKNLYEQKNLYAVVNTN